MNENPIARISHVIFIDWAIFVSKHGMTLADIGARERGRIVPFNSNGRPLRNRDPFQIRSDLVDHPVGIKIRRRVVTCIVYFYLRPELGQKCKRDNEQSVQFGHDVPPARIIPSTFYKVKQVYNCG